MKVKMIATGKVEAFNESYARRLYCAGLAVLAEDAGGVENASGDPLPGSNPALISPEVDAPAAKEAAGADAEPLAGGTDGAENASGDSLPGSNPALIFPEGNTPAASDAEGTDAEPLAAKTDKPGKGRKSR